MAKRELVCMCEARFECEFPDEVDLQSYEIECECNATEKIRSGEFLNAICPRCGIVLKPEFPVHIVDLRRSIDIFFIPELHRNGYFRNVLEYSIGTPNRVVIGYEELVEKLTLLEGKLDDQVIEIIKYYLLSKALDDCGERSVFCTFKEQREESLIFHLQGLKDGEVGVSRIPLSTYEHVLHDLNSVVKQEPFAEILTSPYVSVNKIFRRSLL